jgi:hypothetical protein
MSRFFFGMICGASLLYVAMHYHVVRGDEGVYLVPKISNDLSNVYTDTRGFTLADWKNHRTLAAAVVKSNQQHLMEDASMGSFRDSLRGMLDGLFGSEQ